MAQTGGAASSIVVASSGRQCLLATDAETTPFVLRLATIQGVEGKQDLADLTPEDGFMPAEPVERDTDCTEIRPRSEQMFCIDTRNVCRPSSHAWLS
jgi:hypothetical protein